MTAGHQNGGSLGAEGSISAEGSAERGRRAAKYDKTQTSAVKMLGAREHSVQELKTKLNRRHDETIVDVVITSLCDSGLLSDERFAEMFIRSRIERGHGPVKIRAELGVKGVAEAVYDEMLTHTDAFWIERAMRARAKRFGTGEPVERTEWARQARFLSGRGYPSDVIYATLGPQISA